MLRRLEKGLNTAKAKSQAAEVSEGQGSSHDSPYSNLESGWIHPGTRYQGDDSNNVDNYASTRTMEVDDDDELDQKGDAIRLAPADMIQAETKRSNSFFKTILNPEDSPSPSTSRHGQPSLSNTQPLPVPLTPGLHDPVAARIVTEQQARVIFDAFYLRLNPFINLFDPALHTVEYVRSRCPFLFTTMIMAGCKFFQPESYKACQKLAHEFAVRAFAEAWKRVEVVQAFACLTYWSIPEDNVSYFPPPSPRLDHRF
jgi:hypothetical protein